MVEKNKRVVLFLVGIIAILLIAVLYAFVLSPRVNGYAVERQQEGFEFAIINIAQLASQCQPVPLNLGPDENGQERVMNLVAIECFPDRFPEISAQQQETQQTENQETQ